MRSLFSLFVLFTHAIAAEPSSGPEKGSLFIHGGGRLTGAQIAEFIRLAGGPEAKFVIIPSALEGDTWGDDHARRGFLARHGVKNVRMLHTRDREVADSAEFVEPLQQAQGVWFEGGRQWRLADAYLGTRTEVEFHHVLKRGGVIGGSSAGATIQGSYLVRGAPEGNHIMMARGHEQGFGFLKHAAIDQHVIKRKRQRDLLEVIVARPELLGLGIDEDTALIVEGNRARVLGASSVLVYDRKLIVPDAAEPYLTLSAGQVLDLKERTISDAPTKETAAPQSAAPVGAAP